MEQRDLWRELRRALHMLDRGGELAALVGDQADEMLGFGKIRLHSEDLAADRLGLDEPALAAAAIGIDQRFAKRQGSCLTLLCDLVHSGSIPWPCAGGQGRERWARWGTSAPPTGSRSHEKQYLRGLFGDRRLSAHEGDAHHVGRAGRTERDAGDHDDALAGFGEAFLERDPAGAFDHVVLVARVLGYDAVDAPHER